MDIYAGRKATVDSYVIVPFEAVTVTRIPPGTMKLIRFDPSQMKFEGILGAEDFVTDPNGDPYAFEPRSAGVYHFSLFVGLAGNNSNDLDVTNSYDVLIVRDDNQQSDYLTIGRGYVPDNGGFCNVSAYSFLGPGKESSVHFEIKLNRAAGEDGQILGSYFLLRISKIG